MKKFLLVLLLASFLASAASVKILSPTQQTLSSLGETIDLGVIGPGQTIEVVADRTSGVKAVTSASGEGIALWDSLTAVDLPDGWSSKPSKLYEQPLRAFITASKNAPDGVYEVSLRLLDEYEGANQFVFKAKITISRKVLETSLFQEKIVSGTGQPAVYYIRIANKGSASDAFDISLQGLPQSWSYSKKVFVPFKSETIVPYELIATDTGEYKFNFNVVSYSSEDIRSVENAELKAESSLIQDLRAVSRGALLFPNAEQVIYSALGFLFSFD
ncbi:hypothetical protein HUU53_02945 [Candidatus Micrarchaeota archaeon]|nr:hypothetical protein [Candidatus Micrarchaeota archaeon]